MKQRTSNYVEKASETDRIKYTIYCIICKLEYEDYGKKMLIYAGIAIVGVFFGLQAMFGFPLFKSFESDSVSDARVVIKDANGNCVVEAPDKIPRVIHNCPYDKEDIVSITYKKGTPDIITHSSKS